MTLLKHVCRIEMDRSTAIEYFEGRIAYYQTFSCERLINSLSFNEFVEREDRKSDLFHKRVDFICMAESLKIAMVRETGYKQLKRYLKNHCGIEDCKAQRMADKFNEGSRIYRNFSTIINNCSKFSSIDIRDFTIKELSLAVNLSWIMRRNALIQANKKNISLHVPQVIDNESVEQSVDDILNSTWYLEAKDNPALVARIMNRISDRVINNALYASQR